MTRKYVIPSQLVSKLERLDISVHTLKMTHSYVCAAHDRVDANTASLSWALHGGQWVRTSQVRDDCGWSSQRSNRPVAGVLADQNLGKVFKRLEVTENGRAIFYEFQKSIVDAAIAPNFDPKEKKDQYALLDMHQLASCTSVEEISLYVRCAMHRRQRFPTFFLPGVGCQDRKRIFSTAETQLDEANFSSLAPWAAVRDRWLRAAKSVSKIFGDTIFFIHSTGLQDTRTFQLRVVIASDTTEWECQNLFKSFSGVRYTEIIDGSSRSVPQSEIRERAKGIWPMNPQVRS